jgi:hemolysin III
VALVGTGALTIEAPSTAGRLGVLVFGAGMTTLFATSSLYHSMPWNSAAMRRMRRLDHSMIFILISATFTPFGLLALDGWLRVAALVAAWWLAGVGVAVVLMTSGTAHRRRAGAMIGLGWLSALVAVPVGRQVGLEAVALVAAGGAIYSAGGLIFAYRWPTLWPRVFSYHEVFHTLVVVAAGLHFIAVYHFVLPLAGPRG